MTAQRTSVKDIEPGRLYSLTDAARLVPSRQSGVPHVARSTLYKAIRAGLIKGIRRPGTMRASWFIQGSDIILYLGTPTAQPDPARAG